MMSRTAGVDSSTCFSTSFRSLTISLRANFSTLGSPTRQLQTLRMACSNMNVFTVHLSIILALGAFERIYAQTDVASEADQLIVAAHASTKIGEVERVGRLFPNISESDVTYISTAEEGIRLTLLTRSPEDYAQRVAEIKKKDNIRIDFGLPPLSRDKYSPAKLEKYRRKNGVVVFLRADCCGTCELMEKKSLRRQSLLEFIYGSNIPVLMADYTDSFDGRGVVGEYAKKMNLESVPALVLYPPNTADPIVLTDAITGEQIEKQLKRYFIPDEASEK